MMSKQLVNMMAQESEEMAIWGSIIHWWELSNLPSSKALGRLCTETCSLCMRHNESRDCTPCPLYKVVGRCSTSNDKNPYGATNVACNKGDEDEWKIQSGRMLGVLLGLIGIQYKEPSSSSPKAVWSLLSFPDVWLEVDLPKEEPTCKIGDKFTFGDDDIYMLCLISLPASSGKIIVSMINKASGNRWAEPMEVKGCLTKINISEIKKAFPDCSLLEGENKTT